MTPPQRCTRCESLLEPGDLRCALCGQAAPSAPDGGKRAVATIHRCDGCGAAVAYDAAAGAPRCSFCGSTLRVEQTEDPQEQTEAFLPFTVPEPEARAALRRWLGTRGFFRPGDLRAAARVAALQPLWWVGWIFEAEAWVSWTADSNAGAGRSAWAPHAGQLGLRFANLAVSASRGLADGETRALIPTYDLRTAEAAPRGPEGALKERFDVQRSLARTRILQALAGEAAAEVQAGAIPGTRFRHVHVEPLLRALTTRRFAFPAWVLAYRYRDRLYRAVISGQGEATVVAEAPWSWPRILLVAAAGAALLGALLYLLVGPS